MAKSKPSPAPQKPEATPVDFDLSHYEAEHGQASQTAVQDWSFLPPPHCGKRPWLFANMPLDAAMAAAVEEIGERGKYGVFVVVP